MRAIIAGLEVFKSAPLALVPLSAEGVILALLMIVGAVPTRATGILAGAAFPLDVYFDMKQLLAFSQGWLMFAILITVSVLVRSGILAATMWLADDSRAGFMTVWRSAMRLCLMAAAAFFPIAGLFVTGVGARYAPPLWLAAPLGLAVAVWMIRKGVRLDAGGGSPKPAGTPEVWGFLSYAYIVCAFGAAVSSLGGFNRFLAAMLVVCLGPLHAIFLLGWREKARTETYPGGGTIALAATVVVVGVLASSTFFDRFVHSSPPVARASAPGRLLLLGGADSTAESGALIEFNTRSVGYPAGRAALLSYTTSSSYRAADTHRDLSEIARNVATQIEEEPAPSLLGHSQASLIVDRVLAAGLNAPRRAAFFAPSPPYPPRLDLPAPGERGPGKPGADFIRAVSFLLEASGRSGIEIDAPSAPARLSSVVVPSASVPRLSVWALADSVWLDRDWRRPGEVNVVAITDHVGVTNNARAIRSMRDFFAGREIADDEASWRGALVPLIRYVFEPWRPA